MGKRRETKINLDSISRVFLNKSLNWASYNLCRILVLPITPLQLNMQTTFQVKMEQLSFKKYLIAQMI